MKLDSKLLARASGRESIAGEAVDRLERYAERLLEANQKINLFSRSVDAHLEIRNQITISLLPLRLVPEPHGRWLDIGSGGGFPVMPLAIVCPVVEFIAVEQIAKKAYFLERTAQELEVRNLKVIADDIQAVIDKQSQPRSEFVSIKAVAELRESLVWAGELLGPKGLLITYKPNVSGFQSLGDLKRYGFELSNSLDVKELIDTIDLRVVTYKKT